MYPPTYLLQKVELNHMIPTNESPSYVEKVVEFAVTHTILIHMHQNRISS